MVRLIGAAFPHLELYN